MENSFSRFCIHLFDPQPGAEIGIFNILLSKGNIVKIGSASWRIKRFNASRIRIDPVCGRGKNRPGYKHGSKFTVNCSAFPFHYRNLIPDLHLSVFRFISIIDNPIHDSLILTFTGIATVISLYHRIGSIHIFFFIRLWGSKAVTGTAV